MGLVEARLEFLASLLGHHLKEVERIRKEIKAHSEGRTFPTCPETGKTIYFSEGSYELGG